MSLRTLSVAAFVLASLQAAQAYAQTQPEPQKSEPESTGIDEVVVTAGKLGAQRLQGIPSSITVVDQSRIEKAGIDTFIDSWPMSKKPRHIAGCQ